MSTKRRRTGGHPARRPDAVLVRPVDPRSRLMPIPDDSRARIAVARAARDAAEARLVVEIAQARAAGVTWTSIGEALGVTRQAATQRYAHRLEEGSPL